MTLNEATDLVLGGISKSFGDVRAVDSVSIAVRRGEFYSLLGPSGCGKTTTLRLIAGFELPDAGTIELAGEDITHLPPNKRRVNTVFQHYALFPHLTVQDNVSYGLRQERVARRDLEERLEAALSTVRLQELRHRHPRELSGGQQQRVALARALIKEPTVLLLDEPLAALDLKLRRAMQQELKKLQERVGITFVYVTHDQQEALTLSDRIAVMNGGRLLQEGTPEEIYERPATRFVADFIGQTNFLEAEVEVAGSPIVVREIATGALLRCASGVAVRVGQKVSVAIRPERIQPATGDSLPNVVEGRLVATTYLGDVVQYRVMVGATELTVQRQNEAEDAARGWRTGELVRLGWDESSALVLIDDEEIAGEEDRRLIDIRVSE
ncbi:MAG TPA: ABC transporter ATP-binding protein [Actinomycetota bacterium]|nr:ABC transporter ATP-binding protein [Actinomycetota bacterium]